MVVVTGATGHVGNVLVRELLKRGIDVRAVVLPGENLEPLAGLHPEIVAADVRSEPDLERAFQGADVVYHLAGIVSISSGQTALLQQVNVQGARNVIAACRAAGVRRLVYTSSVHAFVEAAQGTAMTEDTPIDPLRVTGGYARSKAEATLAVFAAANSGLNAVVVFPSGIMGPYDFKGSQMGQLVKDFAHRRLGAYVDGAYDFVDVRDVALGLIAAAEKGAAGRGYILSNEIITVRELMKALQDLTGVPAPRVRIPNWLAATVGAVAPAYYRLTRTKPLFTSYSIHVLNSNTLFDNSRARAELGFAPRPLSATLADSVAWMKERER